MTVEELYKTIIVKRKAAVEDLRQKAKIYCDIDPERTTIRSTLKTTMSELKACIEAYDDLICLIAATNNLELPKFDCCEEIK